MTSDNEPQSGLSTTDNAHPPERGNDAIIKIRMFFAAVCLMSAVITLITGITVLTAAVAGAFLLAAMAFAGLGFEFALRYLGVRFRTNP